MPKLFVFCSSLGAGGAERVLSVLSGPLADHYTEVQYITWYDKDVFYNIDARINIISIEKEIGTHNKFRKLRWLRKYIKSESPDLVLSFSAPFNMIALTSLLFTEVKIIVAERVDPRSFRWGKLLRITRNLLYKKANGILVQTEYCKDYFKGNLYNKSEVIFNPIVMPAEKIGSALSANKANIIVSAGRLVNQKRHDLLIRIFAKFRQIHPDYKLVIYGEGEERTTLERLIDDLALNDCVSLPGVTENLWNKIISAKMFVMTSLFEGMSNSFIEAMCLGLPCISTKVSGATDLIESEGNGILINIDDETALFNAMEKLVTNVDFSNHIAYNATKLYERLNVNAISQQWIEYIDKKTAKNHELQENNP